MSSSFSASFGSGPRYDKAEEVIRLLLQSDEDVVIMRKAVRELALTIRLSLVDQTKLVTAASELARNTLKYGGGGEAVMRLLDQSRGQAIQLVFSDRGPGIADLDQALTDGFSSGGGLGLGLGGAKRLVDEFDIKTAPGAGTEVTIVKWKR